MVKTYQSRVLGCNDEGAGTVFDAAKQALIVAADEETHEEETEDVEDGDAPENLLDCTRKSLDGVLSLCSGETDKFGSGEGERGSDEDCTEAFEAVLESSWVVPIPSAPVLGVYAIGRTAAEYKDERDDQEDDYGIGETGGSTGTCLPHAPTAVSLRKDAQNSSSAYPSVPKMFTMIIKTQKTVIQTAGETSRAPCQ